jgi:hypothetical protein
LIEPRLTSAFQISALIRQAEAGGDFATVLHKGDLTSGAILLVGQLRGENPVVFDRYPSLDGASKWQAIVLQDHEKEDKISLYWKNRVSRDPDLWVIELDVASTERLDLLLAAFA